MCSIRNPLNICKNERRWGRRGLSISGDRMKKKHGVNWSSPWRILRKKCVQFWQLRKKHGMIGRLILWIILCKYMHDWLWLYYFFFTGWNDHNYNQLVVGVKLCPWKHLSWKTGWKMSGHHCALRNVAVELIATPWPPSAVIFSRGSCPSHTSWVSELSPHLPMTDPYVWYIWCHIYHQYTPVILEYIPYMDPMGYEMITF